MDAKYDIVTSKEQLLKACSPCLDLKQGERIGKQLLSILKRTKNGVGLAANQVGIDSSVCVINVTRPIVLVNPQITGKFEKIYFTEACLSFPGDYIQTERYGNIAVKADNHAETLFFHREKNILECVCVQHEIDHLNGIIMHHRQVKGEENG